MAGRPRKTYYVYLLASLSRVLYVGCTSDLARRLAQHRGGVWLGSFTHRYRVTRLVHVEVYGAPYDAVTRERQLKGWTRARKVALIEATNAGWHDLSADDDTRREGGPSRAEAARKAGQSEKMEEPPLRGAAGVRNFAPNPFPLLQMKQVSSMLLGLFLGGCAATAPSNTPPAASSGAATTTAPRPSSDLITRAQLRARMYPNLYEAVRALHSGWLRERGADSFRGSTQVQVYLDGMRMGGTGALRNLSARDVEYVRRYDGNDATARWGLGHGSGVIYVSTRPL
jgi:putative endonuclease